MNHCVVISGSFRKHLHEIGEAMTRFKKTGVVVLAPLTHETQNDHVDFILLKTDDALKSKDAIEQEFLSNIQQADFLYVANVGGYIGQSVATEIAFALLHHIPIVIAEEIQIISDDVPDRIKSLFKKILFLKLPITKICLDRVENLSRSITPYNHFSTDEIESMQSMVDYLMQQLKPISKNMNNLTLPEHPTLQDFQAYVAHMVKERGFDSETISEIFMLLQEEIGELAKAARKTQNIKTDQTSEQFHLAHEAADVFIYLLDICNHFNIDLEKAFREKEEINKKRVWE